MPHTRDYDGVEDSSPMSRTRTMTQSGYTPASDMPAPEQRTTEKVADKVKEKALMQADAGIDKAAERVQSAADRLRERAQTREGLPAEAGTKVADTMEKTAGYLREHDSEQIFDTVRRYAKEHPAQAVAGAIVGAFFLGKFLG